MPKWKARKREALAGAQNWRCAYCQGVMDKGRGGPRAATLEHLVPSSRGGSDDVGNLVAACGGCNAARPSHYSASYFYELRQAFVKDGLWPECTTATRAISKRVRRSPRPPNARRERFSLDEIFDHIEQNHPGCPAVLRGELAHLVAQRPWFDASLGMAFGITATTFVRETYTRYSQLIAHMTEVEARLMVRADVSSILAGWRHARAQAEPSPPLQLQRRPSGLDRGDQVGLGQGGHAVVQADS